MNKKLISLLLALSMLLGAIPALAHPGRTDSLGGHNVRKAGWGYEVGTYHYHSGPYAGYSVDYKGQIPAEFKEKPKVKVKVKPKKKNKAA